MKVLLDHNPLAPSNSAPVDFAAALRTRPAWITAQPPAAQSQFQSLSQPPSGALPAVNAYRLQFDLPAAAVMRVHVSADERYLLYLDGEAVGRGPERGSDRAWFYESYDLALAPGVHTLVALVWQLGELAPLAQVGLAGGFLLEAEGAYGALLSTKSAAWTCKAVGGLSFDLPAGARQMAWFVEPIQTTDGTAYPWGVERGEGEGDGDDKQETTRHEDLPTETMRRRPGNEGPEPGNLDETKDGDASFNAGNGPTVAGVLEAATAGVRCENARSGRTRVNHGSPPFGRRDLVGAYVHDGRAGRGSPRRFGA